MVNFHIIDRRHSDIMELFIQIKYTNHLWYILAKNVYFKIIKALGQTPVNVNIGDKVTT